MPAADEANLEQKLRNTGLWLTDVDVHRPKTAAAAEASGKKARRLKLSGGRGRRELIDFCTLMSFQVRSGISLVKALEVAAQDCKSEGFKEVLFDLQRQIEGGQIGRASCRE